METELKIVYGPRWQNLLFFFGVGVALLGSVVLHLVPFGIGALLGIPPLGLSLICAIRRWLLPRFVELRQDKLSVGTGLLQLRVIKVVYAEILETSEFVNPTMSCLRLHAKERTFEINSVLMPDVASFVAVKDFINSRVIPKADADTCQSPPIEVGKYCFKCSFEGNGEVYDSRGEILWRIKTLHPGARARYPYGIFRLPDFVMYDRADNELFRIKLERKFPLAQFVMMENGTPVCTIRQRSFLLNKYTLEFANGPSWDFRMPLFKVDFGGVSTAAETIRIRLWTHNVWYVFIDPKADNPRLVAALAFIHRERLRCN